MIDPTSDRFLNDLRRIQTRAERAQAQLSSGVRVSRPSDSPDQVGTILDLSAGLDRVAQIRQNLTRVKLEVDSGEQALGAAVAALDRAEVLGTQGASFTTTATGRAALAGQALNVLDQLVGLANTKVEGRYIFSGDADRNAPYRLNLSSANGVTAYAGSASTRQVEDPAGALIPVARDASSIFDNAATASAFAAVNALRLALAANDPVATAVALSPLRAARDQIAGDLSFYGAVQSEVARATEASHQVESQLKTGLGDTRDADLAEAAVELSRAQVQHEAALASRAKLPRTSLFDYLG